jgi:hypothetical protein
MDYVEIGPLVNSNEEPRPTQLFFSWVVWLFCIEF